MTARTFEESAGAYLATVDHDKSDDWVAGFIAAIVWARDHDAKVRAETHDQGYRQAIRDATGEEYTGYVSSQYRDEKEAGQ